MTIIDRCAELENDLRERLAEHRRSYEREMRRARAIANIYLAIMALGFAALVVAMLCR